MHSSQAQAKGDVSTLPGRGHFYFALTGVGSVVDPGTASLYINCGANFVIGPVLNPEVARACNRRKIPYLPGCGTASEISQAALIRKLREVK